MKNVIGRQRGYTLIELLIAIQLAMVVTGLALNSYLLLSRLSSRYQEKYHAEQQLSLVALRFTRQVECLQIIQLATTELLQGLDHNGRQVQFRLRPPSPGSVPGQNHGQEPAEVDTSAPIGTLAYLVEGLWVAEVPENFAIDGVRLNLWFTVNGQNFRTTLVSRLTNMLQQ